MNKMPISLLLFVSLYLNQSFRDNVNKVADDILYILVRETSVQRKRHLILKLTVGIRILLDVESKVLSELFHLPQKHQIIWLIHLFSLSLCVYGAWVIE